MKLEFEIGDITREALIDAMAERLLLQVVYDEETGGSYRDHSELGRKMGRALERRIDELATERVRECFEEVIKARIAATVDEVLAEGWQRTDRYGNRQDAERLDLKARISEMLAEKKHDGFGRQPISLAEEVVQKTVEGVLTRELQNEIEKARTALRAQLDAVVAGKVAETIKTALGLR